jgi:aminodeoxyfutalosine synthase
MTSSGLEIALAKGAAGETLTRQEALELTADLSPDGLHRLGRAALANRRQRFGDCATYVANIQINPSNICSAGCAFCTYAAAPHDAHAYVLQEDEILAAVAQAEPTEAHIVGGLNTVWPYERNLALVKALRQRFPELHIKAFTAVEIDYFARTAGKTAAQVLCELTAAGMNAMTGGGAEIFAPRLRRRHWPKKIPPARWLAIHHLAHGMGLTTNATMLFGLGERWDERVDHLLALRAAQAQTGGFACLIPLAFQPGRGRIGMPGPAVGEILAVTALARLVLDNIPHIKCYWPMIGLETAAAALSWGGDDLDGTIQQERIAHMAGADTPRGIARHQMEATIRMGGFRPVERDGCFHALKRPAQATPNRGNG